MESPCIGLIMKQQEKYIGASAHSPIRFIRGEDG